MNLNKLHKAKLFIVFTILITILIWYGCLVYYDGWYFTDRITEDIIIFKYLGKITAFGATIMICWSFILNHRFEIIKRIFGNKNEVTKLNIFTTKWAFILMFFDPIFLAVNRLPNWKLYFEFFGFRSNSSFYGLGHNLGIIILLIILISTVLLNQKFLSEIAKIIFRSIFGLIPFLLILHIFFVGGDVSRYPLLTIWVYSWLIGAIIAYLVGIYKILKLTLRD